jgi:hypothetical protein
LSKPIPDATVDILNYFIRHPSAADSIEGIARWRLLDELALRKVEEAERAVRWLVDRGLLVERHVPGGRSIFGLNPEKIDEAKRLLMPDSD